MVVLDPDGPHSTSDSAFDSQAKRAIGGYGSAVLAVTFVEATSDVQRSDQAPTGLGARIRELREQHEPPLSLRELGKQAGVDFSYIRRLENGEKRSPSPEVFRALAYALETTEADLLVAGGYLPVGATWMVQEAVADAGYRLLLRRAEAIHDPLLRQFISAAIQTAIGQQGRPGQRR